MFRCDFEVDAWSRFWRWNLVKICVWTCDMNSILGSVVPLAMFFYIPCMCLCSSPKSLKGTAGGQRRPLTWASKNVSFPQWWSQKSFSHRRESYLRLQIMQILLDSNKVSFSSMNKNNSWAMAHTMTWICKLIYLDTWLDLGHLEILYSLPLPERY